MLVNLAINAQFPKSVQSRVRLIYPDPYIGLQNAVLKNAPHPAPITNFPLVLAHVNSSAPADIFLEQAHWPSNFGMIYPEDRTFMVVTIVQFRAVDFGMENCVLVLATHDMESANFSAATTPFPFEIWGVDSTDSVDPRKLSWKSRPRRTHLAASMTFPPGRNRLETPPFSCPSRALFTFEITCSAPGCYLKFLQTNKSTNLGDCLSVRIY
ncbi:hypothetical protein B0H17DRAFT_953229 [Mycena rosella]|uniref:Ubiquitin 3 binding protein But2 C-terminal domain-containing protein n=1 Tax=Mycena rosella TaxID=1033263 RepID=A0AAD7CSP7_MYCRO|nr:hypothetical protein B0H17DRAFT_953229 [Mycena rosella]